MFLETMFSLLLGSSSYYCVHFAMHTVMTPGRLFSENMKVRSNQNGLELVKNLDQYWSGWLRVPNIRKIS